MGLNKSLIKGSIILLIAFGLFNFINFLYQLVLARMLTLSEYATLAALLSIIYVLLMFTEAVQTIVTKYSAEEKDKGRLKNILKRAFSKASYISTAIFLFYLVLSIPLSFLLKINYLLLSLNGLIIFLAFFMPITRGVMQGKERFGPLGLNMILEAGGKFLLGIFFVFIGLGIYGAISGIVLGSFIALGLSLLPLRDIIASKESKVAAPGIYNFAKPAFFITAIIVFFYSLDVIIAKIFFPPELAGSYAIASILAKIIFWGTVPISKAMFPLAVDDINKGKSENIFLNAVFILLIGIIFVLALFYLFPGFIIKLFSGKVIPEAESILFYLGIGFSFISLANLVLLHKLSLGKVRGYFYLFIFIGVEAFLLSYFSKSLFQFSIAFIAASAMLLWGAIILVFGSSPKSKVD